MKSFILSSDTFHVNLGRVKKVLINISTGDASFHHRMKVQNCSDRCTCLFAKVTLNKSLDRPSHRRLQRLPQDIKAIEEGVHHEEIWRGTTIRRAAVNTNVSPNLVKGPKQCSSTHLIFDISLFLSRGVPEGTL